MKKESLYKAIILIVFIFQSLFGNYFILAQDSSQSADLDKETINFAPTEAPTPTMTPSPTPTTNITSTPNSTQTPTPVIVPFPTPTITTAPTPIARTKSANKIKKEVLRADENLEIFLQDENAQIELKNSLDEKIPIVKKNKDKKNVEIDIENNFRLE